MLLERLHFDAKLFHSDVLALKAVVCICSNVSCGTSPYVTFPYGQIYYHLTQLPIMGPH